MKIRNYQAYRNDENTFWFISNGTRGEIIKHITFQKLPASNQYNLALGDYNVETNEIEYSELSNNGDARKVFATVGVIVQNYTTAFPGREIFVMGNSSEKSRAYNFMVSAYYSEIIEMFEVFGAYGGEFFEPFIKDKIYDAILVRRK